MFAGGLAWLYAARSVQGLATGLLLGATGAAMVDLHPRRDGAQAGLANGIASAAGIGFGARRLGPPRPVRARSRGHAVRGDRACSPLLARDRRLAAARDGRAHGARLTLTPRTPRVPRRALADLRALGPRRAGLLVGRRPLPLPRPGHHLRAAGRPEPRDRRPVRVHGLRVRHRSRSGSCGTSPHGTTRGRRRDASWRIGSLATAATIEAGSLGGFLLGSVLVGFGLRRGLHGRPALARCRSAARPPGERDGRVLRRRLQPRSRCRRSVRASPRCTSASGPPPWFGCAVALRGRGRRGHRLERAPAGPRVRLTKR